MVGVRSDDALVVVTTGRQPTFGRDKLRPSRAHETPISALKPRMPLIAVKRTFLLHENEYADSAFCYNGGVNFIEELADEADCP